MSGHRALVKRDQDAILSLRPAKDARIVHPEWQFRNVADANHVQGIEAAGVVTLNDLPKGATLILVEKIA
jgi:hypothetical protein